MSIQESKHRLMTEYLLLLPQVMVQPTGMVSVTGLAAQGTFVRKLLDRQVLMHTCSHPHCCRLQPQVWGPRQCT